MKYIGNLQPGQVEWQAGFTAAQDETGRWTAVHVFKCFSNEVLILTPRKGDACTKDGYDPLAFTSSQTTDIVGSPLSSVTCTYKGTIYTSDGDEDEEDILPTYNTSNVTQSEPIESHDNFKTLSSTEWGEVADYKAGRIIRDPEDATKFKKQKYDGEVYKGFTEDFTPTDLQIELFLALDKGFTAFHSPRIVHTKSYTSDTDLSAATWNKVGKIDTPSNAPTLGGDRNWLFMGANSDNTGNVFEIEMEWMASGETGWDSDYYS
jgi:hypothetical protein